MTWLAAVGVQCIITSRTICACVCDMCISLHIYVHVCGVDRSWSLLWVRLSLSLRRSLHQSRTRCLKLRRNASTTQWRELSASGTHQTVVINVSLLVGRYWGSVCDCMCLDCVSIILLLMMMMRRRRITMIVIQEIGFKINAVQKWRSGSGMFICWMLCTSMVPQSLKTLLFRQC